MAYLARLKQCLPSSVNSYAILQTQSAASTRVCKIFQSGFASSKTNPQLELEELYKTYKAHGVKAAKVDPLEQTNSTIEQLKPEFFGLSPESVVNYEGKNIKVGDLVKQLEKMYCGKLVFDLAAVEEQEERDWFQQQQAVQVSNDKKIQVSKILLKSQCLDNFLAKKFPVLKRYSGEGAEGMLVLVHQLLELMSSDDIEQCIIGMPHRGRNNLLHGELNYPMELMLRKIKGKSEFPDDVLHTATGDVLSHLNTSTTCTYNDKSIHVNLLPNSSHLEAVNPMAMGKCRARQQTVNDGNYSSDERKGGDKVSNILIHGDAAFTGQGVVMESLNMSQLPGFNVGGSLHIIVNNQVGFTTPPSLARSSSYASDPAKMIGCPVIRVNGDSVHDLLTAARVAHDYRVKFRKDVLIDMICYRKWGHNELDDPSFTQPLMYELIRKKTTLPDHYSQQLVDEQLVTDEEVKSWTSDEMGRLERCLVDSDHYQTTDFFLSPASQWSDMVVASPHHTTEWDTGVDRQLLRYIAAKSVQVPEDFTMHETLRKTHVKQRLDKIGNDKPVDWSTGEAMALGSLLLQGHDVRFSGEDVRRGTFSHRHATFTCQRTEHHHTPLNHLQPAQKHKLEIVSSLLSEEAVLGFEYGMSIESPDRLCIWEAQFGDFFNGAQIQLDAFVLSGEAKWMHQSGLVMLLPHGFDGSGSEHSSCRMERFLQCTNSKEDGIDGDSVNVSVCNPTTPAQYFHLLRRQILRNFRKPLVVIAPKTLLRSPAATSSLSEFEPGTTFLPVLEDKDAASLPQTVERVILCSGKHYYTLDDERRRLIGEGGKNDTAIIRIEELSPFPAQRIGDVLKRFENAKRFVWSQEEPRNGGAWSFVAPRFENVLGIKLDYCGREVHPAVASGIGTVHNEEKAALLRDTFAS